MKKLFYSRSYFLLLFMFASVVSLLGQDDRGEETVTFNFDACVVLQHQTEAIVPANRQRLKIGAGERIELWIDGVVDDVTWSLSDNNLGKLYTNSDNTATFEADIISGTIDIIATTSSACNPELKISVEIIEPERVKNYKKVGGAHTQNIYDIGQCTEMSVLPDEVNFYNLEFMELDIMGIGTGHIPDTVATHHPSLIWTQPKLNDISLGNGTLIQEVYHDFAHFEMQIPVGFVIKGSSQVTYNIPTKYRKQGELKERGVKLTTKQVHYFPLDITMPFLVKKDVQNTALLGDLTTMCN